MLVRTMSLVVAAVLSLVPTGEFRLDAASSRIEFFVKDNRGGFSGVVRTLSGSAMVREQGDRKSTRLNSSHIQKSRMPSSA